MTPLIDLARRHAGAVSGLSGELARYRSNSNIDGEDYGDWDNDEVIDDYDDPIPVQDDSPSATTGKTTSEDESATPTVSVVGGGKQQQQQHGTFLFCFDYPTRFDGYPRWTDGIHGEDLAYVFGAPLTILDGLSTGGRNPKSWTGSGTTISPFSSTFTAADRYMSELVMGYWAGFIRNG